MTTPRHKQDRRRENASNVENRGIGQAPVQEVEVGVVEIILEVVKVEAKAVEVEVVPGSEVVPVDEGSEGRPREIRRKGLLRLLMSTNCAVVAAFMFLSHSSGLFVVLYRYHVFYPANAIVGRLADLAPNHPKVFRSLQPRRASSERNVAERSYFLRPAALLQLRPSSTAKSAASPLTVRIAMKPQTPRPAYPISTLCMPAETGLPS